MKLERIGQGFGYCIVIVLLLPVIQTTWISFSPDSFLTPPLGVWSTRWYREFLQEGRWTSATVRSLLIATVAAFGSLLVTVPAVITLRHATAIERRIVAAALLLPSLAPPAALGTGLLPLLHATQMWGSITSVILVHITLGIPIAFLIIGTYLTNDVTELESAASGLGASQFSVVTRVTLLLLAPGFLAAGVSVFVLSLNESLVSLFLATPNNETLPAVVWPQLRYSASPLVAVASSITSILSLSGAFLIARVASHRSRTSHQ